MSTGIEVVASVLGVAGVGFKLSLILNAISLEIINAPHEIKAISKSVILHSQLLKQTAATLERADVHSQDAIKTTDEVVKETEAVFADINTMLDRVRTARTDGTVSTSIPQRIKWCFKKHSMEYLLGRMDRLQMSLSLMLQIVHLGITMASTSRHDSQARVQNMMNKVQRERVEAQTIVIQLFQENQALDRLYVAAREEQTEPASPVEYRKEEIDSDALTLVDSQDSQLTKVDELVQSNEKGLVVVTPYREVFHDLGDDWTKLGDGKQEMLSHSDGIVTRLLERWTRWREKREQADRQPRSKLSGRYTSSVQDWEDDDGEDDSFGYRGGPKEDRPAGKYLEGSTTNWREPHSNEARLRARRLRKAYEPYQASVEGSSDLEASPSSNGSGKRTTTRHVITSDTESTSSEDEKVGEKSRPRRRSSAIGVPQTPKQIETIPTSRSYNPPSAAPRPSGVVTGDPSRFSMPPNRTQNGRPLRPGPVPDQNGQHHAYSSPAPDAYVHGNRQSSYPPPRGAVAQQLPPNYAPLNPYAYQYPQPPSQGRPPQPYPPRLSPSNSRHGQIPRPPSRDAPPRPKSRDGKPPRSPSRLSREYSAADYRAYEEEKKRHRKEARRNLSDGAAKGLLAGGGLAVFLEALDSLDL